MALLENFFIIIIQVTNSVALPLFSQLPVDISSVELHPNGKKRTNEAQDGGKSHKKLKENREESTGASVATKFTRKKNESKQIKKGTDFNEPKKKKKNKKKESKSNTDFDLLDQKKDTEEVKMGTDFVESKKKKKKSKSVADLDLVQETKEHDEIRKDNSNKKGSTKTVQSLNDKGECTKRKNEEISGKKSKSSKSMESGMQLSASTDNIQIKNMPSKNKKAKKIKM